MDYARIHRENLVLFGVLPLTFAGPGHYEALEAGHVLVVEDAHGLLSVGSGSVLETTTGRRFAVRHDLSARQAEIVRQGGAINTARRTAPGRGREY